MLNKILVIIALSTQLIACAPPAPQGQPMQKVGNVPGLSSTPWTNPNSPGLSNTGAQAGDLNAVNAQLQLVLLGTYSASVSYPWNGDTQQDSAATLKIVKGALWNGKQLTEMQFVTKDFDLHQPGWTTTTPLSSGYSVVTFTSNPQSLDSSDAVSIQVQFLISATGQVDLSRTYIEMARVTSGGSSTQSFGTFYTTFSKRQ